MIIVHIGEIITGGVATYLETLYSAHSKEHTLYIFGSRSKSEERIVRLEGFRSIDPYTRNMFSMLMAFVRCRQLLKEIKPDVIHVHSSFAGIYGRLAALSLLWHHRVVYCAHGWSFLMRVPPYKKQVYTLMERLFSYCCKVIIAISDCEYNAALRAGLDRKKLYKVYSGIETGLAPLKHDKRLDRLFFPDKINLLFLGRYDRSKGFDRLMDFFSSYKNDTIVLHTAGSPVIDAAVKIADGVIDHGWVEHSMVPQLLRRCDAVIVPSRWEGFGLVVLEAMKYGKAVLVSERGALPELVQEGLNGEVFRFDNDASWVAMLNGLGREHLKRMGEHGSAMFSKSYTASAMAEQLNRLYTAILEAKR